MAYGGGQVEVVSNHRCHPATSVQKVGKESALLSMIPKLMKHIEFLIFNFGVRDLCSKKARHSG